MRLPRSEQWRQMETVGLDLSEELSHFLARLSDGKWHKACDMLGRWDARVLRLLASESGGRILGGVRGYKLTERATREEMQHVVARHRSQARQMQARAAAIEHEWAKTHMEE